MAESDKQFKKIKVFPHFKIMEFDHTKNTFYSVDKDNRLMKYKLFG